MLTEWLRRIKRWTQERHHDLLVAVVVFLVGLLSFGLGRLSAAWPEGGAIAIEPAETDPNGQPPTRRLSDTASPAAETAAIIDATAGAFVASKSGSAYHLPGCPGAKQIKPENRVWFQTRADAERVGYRPAANCPGL